MLESFWDHCGVIRGLFWDHFGIMLGSFGDHFGFILALFGDHFGVTLGSFGIALESFWHYFGPTEYQPQFHSLGLD